jgi:hypothetical protein
MENEITNVVGWDYGPQLAAVGFVQSAVISNGLPRPPLGRCRQQKQTALEFEEQAAGVPRRQGLSTHGSKSNVSWRATRAGVNTGGGPCASPQDSRIRRAI